MVKITKANKWYFDNRAKKLGATREETQGKHSFKITKANKWYFDNRVKKIGSN